jgi:hypothetical protein
VEKWVSLCYLAILGASEYSSTPGHAAFLVKSGSREEKHVFTKLEASSRLRVNDEFSQGLCPQIVKLITKNGSRVIENQSHKEVNPCETR